MQTENDFALELVAVLLSELSRVRLTCDHLANDLSGSTIISTGDKLAVLAQPSATEVNFCKLWAEAAGVQV